MKNHDAIIPEIGQYFYFEGDINNIFIRIANIIGERFFKFSAEESSGVFYSIHIRTGGIFHTRKDLTSIRTLEDNK